MAISFFCPSINFFFYRYRFFILYIVYGVLSLCVEAGIVSLLRASGLPERPAQILGIFTGILFAFFMNFFFNFKVPLRKLLGALALFCLISVASFNLQMLFRIPLMGRGLSPEASRVLMAGALFILSYAAHLKWTFRMYRRVGAAIYANASEDIAGIFDKIGSFPDFIHVDIVDQSFNPNCAELKQHRIEVVRAYWGRKPIEVHIMSKTPRRYLPELLPFSDVIYIHQDISDPLQEIIREIKEAGVEPGIALYYKATPDDIEQALTVGRRILLLSIADPGYSGQSFQPEALDTLDLINQSAVRREIVVCVDGGINEKSALFLREVEKIVSGNCVLNADNPKMKILQLKSAI